MEKVKKKYESCNTNLNKLDILNLEWPSSDRDLNITTPSLVYLRKKHDIKYKTLSIFNGYYYVLKYRPRMVVMSNFQGAILNHRLAKLIYLSDIKIVTFISKGNFKKEIVQEALWGHNNDKTLYVNKMLVWNNIVKNLFLNNDQKLKDKIITTGGTGFDRYKLLNFISKCNFLKIEKINYKKTIGIAGWGFNCLFTNSRIEHERKYNDIAEQEQIDMHKLDLFKLQKIYKQLIENNKDILFILRYHPGTTNFKNNEFSGLDKYENVFISSKYQNNNYKISDLINISDLWIGYETTTALEAWLLDKQTFLINPTRSDFLRENVHKGSPIVKNLEEAQELIDGFYHEGVISRFKELKTLRKEVIQDSIGYDDGENYIRASKEIMKVLNQEDKKINFGIEIYKEMLKQLLKLFLSRTIFKNRWWHLNYSSNFAKDYQEKYDDAIKV